YFVYDVPAPRRTILVADDPRVGSALQLAASIPPDPLLQCSTERVAADLLATVEWDTVALLLWQAPLPEGETAKRVRSFVDRGGRVVFFPPRESAGGDFLGVRWTSWSTSSQAVAVENWRGDQDLLAQTQSGTALPVGQLEVRRFRGLTGDVTPLAT